MTKDKKENNFLFYLQTTLIILLNYFLYFFSSFSFISVHPCLSHFLCSFIFLLFFFSQNFLYFFSNFSLKFSLFVLFSSLPPTRRSRPLTDPQSLPSSDSDPQCYIQTLINTLLHYASTSNNTFHMAYAELKQIFDVLRKFSSPCSFLIFGLTQETLLWKALIHNGRTVFIDENRYYAAYMEEKHPEIDAYDVQALWLIWSCWVWGCWVCVCVVADLGFVLWVCVCVMADFGSFFPEEFYTGGGGVSLKIVKNYRKKKKRIIG